MYIIIIILKAPVSGDRQLGHPLHLLYHKVVPCCVIVDKAQGVDECMVNVHYDYYYYGLCFR